MSLFHARLVVVRHILPSIEDGLCVLSVYPIVLPPFHERPADILPLVTHILQ